jgi:ferredoxin
MAIATTQKTMTAKQWDVLRIPPLKWIANQRFGRLWLQLPFLLVALLFIYDGFTGPTGASQNLATVGAWVHYRGIVVVVLLLSGNFICMACPFTLPRTLAKRLSLRGRRFPRFLRNKWLAIASLFAMLFFYEYLDMWESPALTAWVVIAYFIGAFVLEAFFTESAFCKYVCPLGTFNFIYATAAPTQISVKNPNICKTCVGKECINGSYSPQTVIRVDQIPIHDGSTVEKHIEHSPRGTLGCGTELFAPQITSNMNCTLCLDCVRACPHDNIGLMTRSFGRELGIKGAWPARWDISLLAIFAASLGIVNAFGMVPPVYALMQQLASSLGLTSASWPPQTIEFIVLGIVFIVGGLLLPTAITLATAQLTRMLSGKRYSLRHTVAQVAPAFVPIGLGIWTAHYMFHFLIGIWTIIPIGHNFLIEHGITFLGTQPDWSLGGIPADSPIIGLIQTVSLMGGFLWSMMILQRATLRDYGRDAMPIMLIWALLILGLMLIALWIFSEPMEMRGTILFD